MWPFKKTKEAGSTSQTADPDRKTAEPEKKGRIYGDPLVELDE